ncbi:MAG TPA: dual specificity protein phosphatase family protein [Blastocatellia bacterium]|nr:dual specificity protein phosphatase family protein [Blastocatellia bacterium]
MRAFRRLSVLSTSTTTFILAFTAITVAQATQRTKTSNIQIKNFGCINESFYRGAQPKEKDYSDLASMGVKTVIDLQRDGNAAEQAFVEAQGMKFFRIPMSDKSQPSADQAELFLKIVNDPENQPVFVHCAGGRHRTGAMSAIYRITHDGWSADQAFAEMKRYDFEYGMGHGPLKTYVYSFYSQIEDKGVVVSTPDQ